ncbi:MAG: tetratricopeptide repeat protein [Phycisphaerae bacterium]|nr:tetratricopeptide repeat protein [Phycisphaerae bacterium]
MPAAHEEIDLSDEWHAAPSSGARASGAGTATSATQDEGTEGEAYELELVSDNGAGEAATSGASAPAGPMSASDFLSEMSSELDEGGALDKLEREAEARAGGGATAAWPGNGRAGAAKEASEDHVPELDQVFQEFRSDMGELNDEDEDLETHYNLGIAYREMGLLDEAIGEFQRVANAVQHGKPFRYAMQCSTMLGMTFIDKGEPQIAALWYARALELPGLKPDTILALRYDLGVAQALAGDSASALKSFRQVYAMNIDYRDVAERIATLQRH